MLAPYTRGDKAVGDGVRDVIDAVAPTASTVLAGLLAKATSAEERERLQALLDQAKQLGA